MSTSIGIAGLPDASPSELPPGPRRGLLARHWRGDYSLARSWWVNGALIFGFGVNVVVFIVLLVALRLLQERPVLVLVVGLGEVALLIAAYVWTLVGTWRAAGKYQGPRFWSILARVLMLCGVLQSAANILVTITTIAQVAETRSAEGTHFGR